MRGMAWSACLFALLVFYGAAPAALGQTWAGGLGSWSDPMKWCGGLPNGGDVSIGNCQFPEASVVTEDISATIGNLTIGSGNSLTILGQELLVNGSSISNSGTLVMSGGSTSAVLALEAAGVTLSGGGKLVLSDATNNLIDGNTATTLVNQETIQGAGVIGNAGNFTLNNATGALVNANATHPLQIRATFTLTNAGTLQASSGGTMQLIGSGPGIVFNNTGGLIQALDKSAVTLDGANITGGNLATTGSGLMASVFHLCSLSNLTNAGYYQAGGTGSGSAPTTLFGTIRNSGVIGAGSASFADFLGISGTVNLTGGGKVTVNNSQSAIGGIGTSPFNLINADNTIDGIGNVGGGPIIAFINLTNQGTVNADQPGSLIVNATTTTNQGTMEASNGGNLSIQSPVDNTGGAIAALAGSTVTLGNMSSVKNGTLTTSGSGTIQASLYGATLDTVTNSGTLVVPNTAMLTLKNTITNSGIINLAATTNFAEVNIGGAVTLQGRGTVVMSNNANNFFIGSGNGPNSLTNMDNLIEGSGSIVFGGVQTLVNIGTMYANQKVPLLVGAVASGALFTNAGTLQVKKGSTLIANSSFGNFSGTTLTGGTYIVGGTFEFPGANIVTNTANISLTSNTAKILNTNNNANALASLAANASGASLTVSGKQALVTGAAFTNAGNSTVAANSKFTTGGNYTQTAGTTKVDGTLAAPSFLLNGGILEGAGIINAPVNSSSDVIVGDSKTKTGTLAVAAFTQTFSGTLDVQIAGSTGNSCGGAGTTYSQLVAGGLALDGTLHINVLHHAILNSGDCFNIATGAQTGQFATVTAFGTNAQFQVVYNGAGVKLIVQ